MREKNRMPRGMLDPPTLPVVVVITSRPFDRLASPQGLVSEDRWSVRSLKSPLSDPQPGFAERRSYSRLLFPRSEPSLPSIFFSRSNAIALTCVRRGIINKQTVDL